MSGGRRKKRAVEGEPGAGHTTGRSAGPASAARAAVGSTFVGSLVSSRFLAAGVALIAANIFVYSPVWRHEFVNFDDPDFVQKNPFLSTGLTWASARWVWTATQAANWHPVTGLSHLLDIQLYGLSAGGHHVTNLLLHIANTLLLLVLLHRTTGKLERSAFTAALFAVHPLHVESVAWVAERKDVLSALFWMLTLLGYVEYVRRPSARRYAVVFLLLALGLMAKAMLVTLPFVLLLLDIWPLGRLRLSAETAARPESQSGPIPLAQLVWEKVPLFFLTAVASVITVMVQRSWGSVTHVSSYPLDLRLANAVVSYSAYLVKMIWPAGLAVFYPYARSIPSGLLGGSFLLLTGLSAGVLWACRRRPYLLTGWLWYLGTLVPVIGIVQVGEQAMADRYTYIPLIGIFLMLAWGVADWLGNERNRELALGAAALAAVLGYAVAARAQVQYWKDSATLWRHTLDVTTDNYTAHTLLGTALEEQGKTEEAIAQYREAVRIRPAYLYAQYDLGNALSKQGKQGEAAARFAEAVHIKPDLPEAHHRLGNALASSGKFAEAMAQYNEALRLKPDFAEVQMSIAMAMKEQGRVEEAIAHLQEAVRMQPRYAEAHYGLGNVFASQGKWQEAAGEFNEVLRIQPDFAAAHANLGVALAQAGRLDEAASHFAAAARLQPNSAEAHSNLGLALEKQGKVQEARREYSEALRISPDNEKAKRLLEALESQAGVKAGGP